MRILQSGISGTCFYFSPAFFLKEGYPKVREAVREAFYAELLYIWGLEEKKEKGGKRVIGRLAEREEGSIVERAIEALKRNRGLSSDEGLFEEALSLSVTWMNRVLFLKLLETNLIGYGSDPEDSDSGRFLSYDKIGDFRVLNDLFFEILAKKEGERLDPLKKKFPSVPYLNSSLFQKTDGEKRGVAVEKLEEGEIRIRRGSVLSDKTRRGGVFGKKGL